MTRPALLCALPLVAVLAGACSASHPTTVVVGSKAFTEGVILGDVVALIVEAEGVATEHRRQLGGTAVLWNALLAGEIDVYPEYTGTITQELLADLDLLDASDLRAALRDRGVVMSEPLGFNNSYALGMIESRAAALGIETVSDLRAHPDLRFGFSNEFMERDDGWPALRRAYALPQIDVTGLDHDLAYRGLADGGIAVTDLYTTDAEIAYYGLRVLRDDRGYFPRYDAVLLYRADLPGREPNAVAALARLEGAIDEAAMIAMNGAAKLDGLPEPNVAADFLALELGYAPEDVRVAEVTMLDRLGRRTAEHLLLVAISLSAAVLLAIPLGIWAYRRRRAGQAILAAVGIVQTVPSLALLVFMIPLLGIGTVPAIAALFLYSLLPIVRNTHAGLGDIPSPVHDSARALGLPPGARLRLVELPLASRAILAGIKTSAVINIGTATLGALIGAGGYGQPILTGIRRDDIGLILEGAVPAALLALVAQGLFELAERWLVPRGLRLPIR